MVFKTQGWGPKCPSQGPVGWRPTFGLLGYGYQKFDGKSSKIVIILVRDFTYRCIFLCVMLVTQRQSFYTVF